MSNLLKMHPEGLYNAFKKKKLLLGRDAGLSQPNQRPQQNLNFDETKTLESIEPKNTEKLLNSNEVVLKLGQNSKEYNPDKYPPDITMAKLHAQARRVSIPNINLEELTGAENKVNTNSDDLLCDCCGCQINNTQCPMCINKKDLLFLGSGYPLFFEFIVWGIGLLMIIFLISSIYCLITNSLDKKEDPDDTWFIGLSLRGDKNDHKTGQKEAQMIINFFSILGTLIFLQFFRIEQRKTAFYCDFNQITPTDYTVQVSNLPIEFTEDELKNYFLNLSTEELTIKMVKMNKCFKIGDYISLLREKNRFLQEKRKKEEEIGKWQEKLANTETTNKNTILSKIRAVQVQIQILDKNYKKIEQNIIVEKKKLQMEKTMFTGTAYINFETPRQTQFVKRALKKSTWERLQIYFKRAGKINERFFFKGNMIYVEKAPEPNDIIWENLGVDWMVKFKKELQTLGYTTILLLFCFAAIFGITQFQKWVGDEFPWLGSKLITFINSLGSILISVINYLLNFVIRRFAAFEKHRSYTGFDSSVARKKTIAQFMNTALIYFIVSSIRNDFDSKYGLINQLFNICISTLIVNSLLFLFDPMYLYRLYNRRKVEKMGTKSFTTQAEANALFEGPMLDIANLYAMVVNIMLLAAFYATLTPMIVLFAMIILSVFYWVFKYLLLRRSSIPALLGKTIAYDMIEYVEYVPFVMALGDLLFNLIFYEDANGWSISALCLCFINFVFPMKLINKRIFPFNEKQNAKEESSDFNLPFSQGRLKFTFEYDRLNPITQKKAIQEWVSFIEKKEGEADKIEAGRNSDEIVEQKQEGEGNYEEKGEAIEEKKENLEKNMPRNLDESMVDSGIENYAALGTGLLGSNLRKKTGYGNQQMMVFGLIKKKD